LTITGKKKKKALLTKIKTPTHNHPDEKSTKLAQWFSGILQVITK